MDEIDAAVNKFQPVTPDHEFYVNFENLRGEFQEREVMRILNVEKTQGQYRFNYQPNRKNKTMLFLAGFLGELISRNSLTRNTYLIEKKTGL